MKYVHRDAPIVRSVVPELHLPYKQAIKDREIIRQLMNAVRTCLDSRGGTSYISVIAESKPTMVF